MRTSEEEKKQYDDLLADDETGAVPDHIDPGNHKKHFVIFDFCGNFEFFGENPDGYKSIAGQSVSAQIFEKRLLLAAKLRNEPWKQNTVLQEYREQLINMLHQQIVNLEKQSIQVRPHLKLVHKLEDRGVWEHLESHERKEIVKKLAEVIPVELNEDERSRRFDLLMMVIQHELLDGVLNEKPTSETVIVFAEHLWQKRHIPAIKKVKQTLQRVMDEAFWKEPGLLDLEEIRVKHPNKKSRAGEFELFSGPPEAYWHETEHFSHVQEELEAIREACQAELEKTNKSSFSNTAINILKKPFSILNTGNNYSETFLTGNRKLHQKLL